MCVRTEIFSEEFPAIESPEHGLTDVKNGAVRFENVSFIQPERDVLEDITLSFARLYRWCSQHRKTTLIQLIARW